ncbi:tetratricopeptide repeat protein [Flexithrix dorotheae]|uniref:tetratricopeptide repeat protein n=1 Tax=Flexithrix dorotheae TaxID=70993 RepID=UPI00036587E8|nr:tetratricopeptide repeat protein [Flexithrix dorotheae]
MSGFLFRAQILVQQDRFKEAETELKKAIAENPNDAMAYAFLAECQSESNEHEQALKMIKKALSIDPGNASFFYILSKVYLHWGKLKEAEEAIDEAIGLDPYDANYFLIKSNIAYQKGNWEKSLSFAEKGLEVEAEHVGCINMRAMALVKLNRKKEAAQVMDYALNKEPENSYSHANKGWAKIELGEYNEAMEIFKEALRLDPNNQYAKEGLKESIKGKNYLYRIILNYFLWMSKLSKNGKWFMIIGLYVVFRFLRNFAESNPEFAPLIYPLIAVYILFVFSTWIATPVSDLFLRLHPLGKHALSKDEIFGSNLVGLFLVGGILTVVSSFIFDLPRLILFGGWAIFMLIPIGGTFSTVPKSKGRVIVSLYTAALGIVGLLGLTLNDEINGIFLMAFVIGFFLFTWVVNYFAINKR